MWLSRFKLAKSETLLSDKSMVEFVLVIKWILLERIAKACSENSNLFLLVAKEGDRKERQRKNPQPPRKVVRKIDGLNEKVVGNLHRTSHMQLVLWTSKVFLELSCYLLKVLLNIWASETPFTCSEYNIKYYLFLL